MPVFRAVVVSMLMAAHASAQQSPAPECGTAAECTRVVHEAIGQSQFERAHDAAWRALRLGPRNDTALMFLLARTQSLVGRPHDALVMLQRILAMGFRPDEVETHDDFRRVRALPSWPDLQAELHRATEAKPIATPDAPTATKDAPAAAAGSPAAPKEPDVATPARAEAKKVAPPAVAREARKPPATPKPATPKPRTAPPAPPEAATTAPVAPPPAPPAEPDATAAPVAPAVSALRVPNAPLALAYDSVSARFVVADESSDTLKVVDERTGNVIDLVSPGWAGAHRPAAIAIDPRRGELWATCVDTTGDQPRSTIYKLQLVSGRLLQTISLAEDAGPVELVDVAVGRNTIFVLDAVGRRVFSVAEGARTARVVADLETLDRPVSLAASSDTVLYVAYGKGLARVDLNGRRRLPVPVPAAADVSDLQSITWHDGTLFAIQRNGDGRSAARIRLNPRGTTAIALEMLGPAMSKAGAVYDGVFYYVSTDADGSIMLRGTRVH